jgi:uncharacterized protein YdeI (BOF family)
MSKKLLLMMALLAMSTSFAMAKATNGEWVTVSGKVTMATGVYFILDKGSESIKVEMDDWDWYKEGYKILKGDNVIVHGRIDHDFLEKRTIEAGSVYVKSLNTYFYASSDDEEFEPYASSYYWKTKDIPEGVVVELTGHIDSVSGRKFILNTGTRKIKVDTSTLAYNPLDDEGFFKISKGDRVRVSGKIEENWFSKNKINASWLIILKNRIAKLAKK